MRIRAEVHVSAPAETAWETLADLASHVDWMADAESITFLTSQRRGAGTAFDCHTRVGPLRTRDRMTVTAWDEGSRLSVEHRGLVRGEGTFELRATGEVTCRLEWTENLRFPWYLGGPLAALAARPVLRRVWMGNLARFATRVAR